MKTILVPTDFSKVANNATDVAFNMAKKAGANVLLLHIVEGLSQGSFNVEGQIAVGTDYTDKLFTLKLIEKSKNQLQKVVTNPKYSAVKVDGELKMGNPFHGIQSMITKNKVDLIVMGTEGRTSLTDALIGSNTEKVIRHSHCPVLTVSKVPVKTKYDNIVYATSMTESEEAFSPIVKNIQNLYNSKIHLLRVNTPGSFTPDHEVIKQLNSFAKRVKLKNFTVNIYNDLTVEMGILRFTEMNQGDLIAIDTHSRWNFSHLISGSVAEAVVRSSKCPVLTYVIG